MLSTVVVTGAGGGEMHPGRLAVLGRRVALDHDPGPDVDAAPGKGLDHDRRHVAVDPGEDARQGLEDGHLGAHVGQHGGKFAADGPPADDHRRLRQLFEVEDFVAGEHEPTVEAETGDGPGHRPGSQDDRRRRDLGDGTIGGLHLYHPSGGQRARPGEGRHLAPFEQALKPFVLLVDDLALAHLSSGKIDGPAVDADAVLLGPFHRPVDGRRLQELLGRDATAVQAGTAHLLLLDQRDAQPGAPAVKGGGVAGRPSADDHDIK